MNEEQVRTGLMGLGFSKRKVRKLIHDEIEKRKQKAVKDLLRNMY